MRSYDTLWPMSPSLEGWLNSRMLWRERQFVDSSQVPSDEATASFNPLLLGQRNFCNLSCKMVQSMTSGEARHDLRRGFDAGARSAPALGTIVVSRVEAPVLA